MIENKDFELIPFEEEHWNIRILSGPYIETVFYFKGIKIIDGEDKLRFGTQVIEHQMGDWDWHNDLDWHAVTRNVLLSIFDRVIMDK